MTTVNTHVGQTAGERAGAPVPVPPSGGGGTKNSISTRLFGGRALLVLVSQLILFAVILAVWELASGSKGEPGKFLDEFTTSTPSAIWEALKGFQDRGELGINILMSYRVTLIGFTIGAAAGFLMGLVLGSSRYLADVLSPLIGALYSTPRLALMPLFLLWFGIGDGAKTALVVGVVFFLVFYATFAGVREVDPQVIDRMKLMRAGRISIYRKAVLPSAASYIVEGLRVSGPFALVSAVTAEMFSSNHGMGYLLMRSATQFDTAGVFACIIIMSLMGILLMGSIRLLEARLLRWKPERIARAR